MKRLMIAGLVAVGLMAFSGNEANAQYYYGGYYPAPVYPAPVYPAYPAYYSSPGISFSFGYSDYGRRYSGHRYHGYHRGHGHGHHHGHHGHGHGHGRGRR